MFFIYSFLTLLGIVLVCCIIPSYIASCIDSRKAQARQQIVNELNLPQLAAELATSIDEGIDLHFDIQN